MVNVELTNCISVADFKETNQEFFSPLRAKVHDFSHHSSSIGAKPIELHVDTIYSVDISLTLHLGCHSLVRKPVTPSAAFAGQVVREAWRCSHSFEWHMNG